MNEDNLGDEQVEAIHSSCHTEAITASENWHPE